MSTRRDSIYDYEGRMKRYMRILRGLSNSELAFRFLNHLGALGLSEARICKYASHLIVLLRVIDFDPSEASKSDVERVVSWINSQPYSDWTKHDKKLILKKLIQYAKYGGCDRETPLPPEVSWIKLKVERENSRIAPQKLLTMEEFNSLIKAAVNPRDRAMLYVLFEAALRPGELLTMTVGSVEFRDNYCLIAVKGKTGIKRIPLVISHRPLLYWLESHPYRDKPNAPLWVSLSRSCEKTQVTYRYFRQLLKRLARKAGLKKEVWPYLFRHSMLTKLAKVFTEARLEQFAGWVHGSEMSRRYVHFSARDLEDAMLELHGLKKAGEAEDLPKLVECPRCGDKNPPGNVRCGFCGYILDREFAFKVELEEEREKRRREEMIIERIERLERIVYRMLGNPEVKRQE